MMNSCDNWVANCTTISRCLHTELWHVDDIKLSCKLGCEITKLLLQLVHTGKNFDYLGKYFDYSKDGIFTIPMIPFIDKILDDSVQEIIHWAHVSTMTTCSRWGGRNNPPRRKCHKVSLKIAQLMFLQKHMRWEIHAATCFLSSIVKCLDDHDWGNLVSSLKPQRYQIVEAPNYFRL